MEQLVRSCEPDKNRIDARILYELTGKIVEQEFDSESSFDSDEPDYRIDAENYPDWNGAQVGFYDGHVGE